MWFDQTQKRGALRTQAFAVSVWFLSSAAFAQPPAAPAAPAAPASAPAAPASAPASAPAAGSASSSAKPSADGTADREIYIDVGRAGARKLRLAIPTFGVAAGAATPAADRDSSAARLTDILNFTSAFEFIPASGFTAKPDPASRPLNYDEWTPINTEAVIFGKYAAGSTAQKANFEFRLYDIKKKKLLVGKQFSDVDKKDQDRVLRRFADYCIQALTGEMGIFSTKIAFVGAKKQGDSRQVYMANFDGSGIQQITDNGSINMSPSWSPDGTKLTYTSFKDGKAEIYVYNLLTKRTGRLTNSTGNNSGSNWSPDGKTIAFAGSVNGNTAIYTMNSIDGTGRKQFVSGSGLEVEPAFSPEGSKLAFVSGRFGNPHLFVRDLATGADTRITFAGWYNSSPSWRPDGRKLAFAGYDREIDRYDVFIVNPDGRQMERLTLDQGDNEKPSWSPDGRFIVFQSNRAPTGRGKVKPYKLFVMNRDGAEQRALKIPLADVSMPAWSPRLNEFAD